MNDILSRSEWFCQSMNSLAPSRFGYDYKWIIFKLVLEIDILDISAQMIIALRRIKLDFIQGKWTLF